MKVRSDFVTNSSSSSFIIATKNNKIFMSDDYTSYLKSSTKETLTRALFDYFITSHFIEGSINQYYVHPLRKQFNDYNNKLNEILDNINDNEIDDILLNAITDLFNSRKEIIYFINTNILYDYEENISVYHMSIKHNGDGPSEEEIIIYDKFTSDNLFNYENLYIFYDEESGTFFKKGEQLDLIKLGFVKMNTKEIWPDYF